MKRSNLIKYGLTVLTASTALMGVGGTAQAQTKKPNIVIIWATTSASLMSAPIRAA